MQTNVTFPSSRLMLTLFVCGLLPVLLSGHNFLQSDSLFANITAALFGVFFLLLCFVPIYFIKHRTRLDFSAFAKQGSKIGFFFVSAYYAIYFAVISVSFLIRYGDMFKAEINPDANTGFMVFIILCVGVYGASKGINPLSRVSIFAFAVLITAFAVIISGSIKSFDFETNRNYILTDFSGIKTDIADCLVFSFLPVIFAFTSTSTKKLRVRNAVIVSAAIYFAVLSTMFFTAFVNGAYAENRQFSIPLLSKTAAFGDMKGFDSFYLCAVTVCVFVLITALLISFSNCFDGTVQRKTLWFVSGFALIIFILFICAEQYNAVKELLTNSVFLTLLNFAAALVIPGLYLFIYRRKLYA